LTVFFLYTTHCRIESAVPQGLDRARSQASGGSLLEENEAIGPYGHTFWSRVAAAMPSRSEGECIDAFIALRRSPVARFSSSGRNLSPKTSPPNRG
jgi:hypothetical protein